MPMIRITSILSLIMLAGCADSGLTNSGIAGPTGRSSDSGNIKVIGVRNVWKQDLRPDTRSLVIRKLPLGKTAIFDGDAKFDGYYDSGRDVTRVGVYGNVTT